MRYADYFPEYAQYFGRALKLLKSMYGITNSGNLFADEIKEWLIDKIVRKYKKTLAERNSQGDKEYHQ